ncbi:gibberellin 20 oxidase 2-like [Canna indica]|uniref:Gibberellin 20 oxidase 2-like n=1 Tax=Canna indica TaxID=4628 RepID=A0AAQ3JQY2_9LILI|nr:gibberellin 20 oxidase 2-like [Canna indica]
MEELREARKAERRNVRDTVEDKKFKKTNRKGEDRNYRERENDRRARLPPRPSAQYEKYTSFNTRKKTILCEIYNLKLLKYPANAGKQKLPPNVDMSKKCSFHDTYGHTSKDCVVLGDQLEDLSDKVYSRKVDLSTITSETRYNSCYNPDVRFRHFNRADKCNLRYNSTSILRRSTLDKGPESDPGGSNGEPVFNSSVLRNQSSIPKAFIWRPCHRATAIQELDAPVVDLDAFLRGDEASIRRTIERVAAACSTHGFFQVANHGVDASLLKAAFDCATEFFELSLCQKLHAQTKPGSMWGYAGAHTGRFSSELPWKETLSFSYHETPAGGEDVVVDYFMSTLGNEFERMGLVFQRYCEAMKRLSLVMMEMLGMSLGVERRYYREFFEDSRSIMRCNYYPPCQEPELTLGTGPHCDPTSITILQQDQVEGLQVFDGGRWRSVRPIRDALVINIGDTFMALSNGRYKSCLHRAVVNRHRERRSLAFFVCPRADRVIRPPPGEFGGTRLYPDFTWAELMEFTQCHYRADMNTLHSFTNWLFSSSFNM